MYMEEIKTTDQTNLVELAIKIDEKCDYLNSLMVDRIQARDELINRLHEELEYYKKDCASKFENQLLKAVIKVRQDMKKKLNNGFFDGKDAEQILLEYTYAFEDLTDLLEQQLCDEIVSEEGDMFNPAIHQAKIERTDDQSLDKTIKCSLSAGFKKDGKVLIPERVIAYQFKNEE